MISEVDCLDHCDHGPVMVIDCKGLMTDSTGSGEGKCATGAVTV